MKEIFTSETFQMLSDRIDTFMEEHDVYDYDNVTIVVEKVKDETDLAGYIWKATLVPKDTASTLKDMLVEEHGIVRHFWSKVDIQEWATNRYRALTDDELEKVAYSLAKTDCEYGISWQTIDDTITNLIDFGDDEGEEEDDSGIEYLRSIGKKVTDCREFLGSTSKIPGKNNNNQIFGKKYQ